MTHPGLPAQLTSEPAGTVVLTAAFLPLEMPGPWTSVGERLDHLAAALPEVVAVEAENESLTYSAFVARVRDRAGALSARPGGGPIAFPVEPGVGTVVALFALILAGRPALPLDPMLPGLRREQILADSGADLLTVDEIDALPGVDTDLPPRQLLDPAIVFYTSGSSGKPKGVVHTHGTLLNQAHELRLSWRLEPGERHAFVLPMSFGAGQDSIFMTLLNGGTLVVHDPRVSGLPDLLTLLRGGTVDTMLATPSLLAAVVEGLRPAEVLPRLRLLSTQGEAIHSSQVERIRDHLASEAEFMGSAGASEIGNLAFHRMLPGSVLPEGIVPAGTPAANKRVDILDADGQPVGPGVTGEVVVTSAFLSAGYWRNAEQTATRFTANTDGTTTYRGGDLGRWDDSGALHLRGRADAAVKVAGYLVEPAEVEAALLALPGVAQAVVSGRRVAHRGGGTRVELVAHVVPVRGEFATTPALVRRGLRDRLPSWMVPSHVMMLTEMPRTERGKVDRQILPTPEPVTGLVSPTTPTEHQLAELWASVLGLPEVGVDADFWAAGGDSLAVEELLAAIGERFGRTPTSTDLLAAPTIAEFAALLDRAAPAATSLPSTTVRLRTGRDSARPSVFFYAGGGAPALSMVLLAAALSAPVTVHGFQAAGYERRERVDRSVDSVVNRHLAALRTLAPSGPSILVGHSFGGLVALETASRLAATGHEVPLVVLLDTRLPAHLQTPGQGPEEPTTIPPARQRWAMHARLLGAGLLRYDARTQDSVFWEQSLRMANRHTPKPWAGRTVLFTAPDNTDDPQDWAAVLTGEHRIVPVEGGHSAMLRAPFDRPIVELLDAEITAVIADLVTRDDGQREGDR